MGDPETTREQPGGGAPRSGERLRKGRTLAERRQERRESLLAAALDAFGTRGYTHSTIEDICRQAYVSSRDFYAEFSNRERLLEALTEQLSVQIYRAFTEVTVEPGSDMVHRRTRARVDRLIHALVDDPRVARVATIESVGVSPAVEARRREAHNLYADWLCAFLSAEFRRQGVDGPRQRALALALVGAVNELVSDWILRPEGERDPVEQLIEVVVDLAVKILPLDV